MNQPRSATIPTTSAPKIATPTSIAARRSVKLDAPRFSGAQSDFTTWARKTDLYFRSLKLGQFLGANEDETPLSKPQAIITGDEMEADEHVRSILLLNALPDSIVDSLGLMSKLTAAECWRALFNAMHPSTKSTVVRALQQFVAIRQQPNEQVQHYVARTIAAADQLRSIAPTAIINVTDELTALLTRIGLNSSLNGAMNSIYCKHVDQPVTVDEVTNIALEAESRMEHSNDQSCVMSANAATTQYLKTLSSKQKSSDLKRLAQFRKPVHQHARSRFIVIPAATTHAGRNTLRPVQQVVVSIQRAAQLFQRTQHDHHHHPSWKRSVRVQKSLPTPVQGCTCLSTNLRSLTATAKKVL